MSLKNIPAGKSVPKDINVIIEIPAFSAPIKYEVEKESGALFVDRFVATPMFYPCNYGYINQTLAEDGDPVDVLVDTPYPLLPGVVIRCRPVGILKMEDEKGPDAKIIAVPHDDISKDYQSIKQIHDISAALRAKIIHFFTHYKELEPGKYVKIDLHNGWGDVEEAEQEILFSLKRYKK